MAAALPWITTGIGGILGGIGATKGTKSGFTEKSDSTQSGVLEGKQRKVNRLLGQQLIDWLRLGPQVSQSDRNTLRGQVNQEAEGARGSLESNLAARGFGTSGKAGQGFKDIETGRMKAFQTGEASLRSEAMNRFLSAMGLGLQYDQPRTFTSSGTRSGTSMGGGMNPFSAFGSGFSDLSSLLFMRNMGMLNPVACWIAEELYGKNDWRVMLIRAWLCHQASRSLRWRLIVLGYQLSGRSVAAMVRKSAVLHSCFRSFFDRIVFRVVQASV